MEEEKESVQFPIHNHPLTPCILSNLPCFMCFSSTPHPHPEGYRCRVCIQRFHKECAESPMELNHPYHPPHPLSLRRLGHYLGEASELCSCCREELGKGWVYHCAICKFFIHLLCAMKPPVLEVAQPKSHDHKLFLLPKPRPFTCDACGLMLDSSSLPWACLKCGVMIHRECIDLPRVIRISRHPQHRLRYASSPPPRVPSHEAWYCGVCRKVVNNQYGAYSCIRGCHYVVHSKCATREDVWDGIDLEGEPEESEDVEPPFEVIDDKVIRHFSHEHHLQLKEDDSGRFDRSKCCRICVFSIRIHLDNIYRCTQSDCDFTIHETCANLPRKIWYMLHPHRLKLQPCRTKEMRKCHVCARYCFGFIYECCKEGCRFVVDVDCASVSEPCIHISHPHPLFSASISTDDQACSICKEQGGYYRKMMHCIECDFILCFKCITLPIEVNYDQDRHPLVLGIGDEEGKGGNWWCEICEGKMEPEKELFYTCDRCCVTVHVRCILGEDPHVMLPDQYLEKSAYEFEVEANNSCCRPLCHRCRRRCPFPVVYVTDDRRFCTLRCLWNLDKSV